MVTSSVGPCMPPCLRRVFFAVCQCTVRQAGWPASFRDSLSLSPMFPSEQWDHRHILLCLALGGSGDLKSVPRSSVASTLSTQLSPQCSAQCNLFCFLVLLTLKPGFQGVTLYNLVFGQRWVHKALTVCSLMDLCEDWEHV